MDIRAYLSSGKTFLFDGAMGTYYASLPEREQVRCEEANILYASEILEIHRAYLRAGAMALKTNTYGLSEDFAYSQTAESETMLRAGCRLAKSAAAEFGAIVFGDIGPAPDGGARTPAECFIRQADLFLDEGITHFLVETLSTTDGIAEFAAHVKKKCPEAFLIVSYAVGYDGVSRDGLLGQALYDRTRAMAEVDVTGFNCGSGPHHLVKFLRTLRTDGAPMIVMPNAGNPTVVCRKTVYHGTPEYFSEKMLQAASLPGALILGGCCGTTPEHIAAMKAALEAHPPVRVSVTERAPETESLTAERNLLWEKLESGKRVVAVELDPPVDDDIGFFVEGVRTLRDAGVDAVTIADCPIGRPRADSSLLAAKIHRELGVEPLPHMTCRDRNLNATKALLLGLTIEGVHNVLLVTGDPIPSENRDEVKSVFNFNSRKLARFVSSLNETALRTPFQLFGALNVNARNFEIQLDLAKEKEEAGVCGFLTQPVLSPEAMENLQRAREELRGKLLGGIFPVVSHRNAVFLNNEIAGIRVSDEIIARYEGKSREECEAIAVELSVETANQIAPYTDGLYIMTPFKRVALIERILKALH